MSKQEATLTYRLSIFVLMIGLSGFFIAPSQAAMISTERMVATELATQQRTDLQSLLQRDEVKAQLTDMGVRVTSVEKRIAAMTDTEVTQLTTKLEEMPAGGGLLGAAVVIFVVFVITDAIGATDIFTFVRPVN